MLRTGIISLITLVLTGCIFDDDVRFYPETRASFLLIENAGQHNVVKIQGDQVVFNWANQAGITVNDVADIGRQDEYLWLAVPETNSLLKTDPINDQIISEISTQSLKPDFLIAGENVILVVDTGVNVAGFYLHRPDRWAFDTLAQIRRGGLYLSGKFYLGLQERQIGVFHEKTLSQIATIEVEHPVSDLGVDNRSRIYVHARGDSSLFRSQIDYNADALVVSGQEVNYTKIVYTPYRERPLGKEFLRDIQLVNGKLNVPGAPECRDMEADFFESIVYFIREDSLYKWDLDMRKEQVWGHLNGNFQKAEHFLTKIN